MPLLSQLHIYSISEERFQMKENHKMLNNNTNVQELLNEGEWYTTNIIHLDSLKWEAEILNRIIGTGKSHSSFFYLSLPINGRWKDKMKVCENVYVHIQSLMDMRSVKKLLLFFRDSMLLMCSKIPINLQWN